MKTGPFSQSTFRVDDEKYSSIEKSINEILQEEKPCYEKILDIVTDISVLRIQSSTYKTTLWLIARHSDNHPELLKIILKKYSQDLFNDDFAVSPKEGIFKGMTVKWLAQFAPVACDDEFEQILTKTIQQFDKTFVFGLNYSNVYLPSQSSSRTERLGNTYKQDHLLGYSTPKC